MSLDISLSAVRPTEVYSDNITHNLTGMASAAGLYRAMWRPEELNISKAGELIPILASGLQALLADPEKFTAMNPPNGWGDYSGFLDSVQKYLEACRAHPDADISVSR